MRKKLIEDARRARMGGKKAGARPGHIAVSLKAPHKSTNPCRFLWPVVLIIIGATFLASEMFDMTQMQGVQAFQQLYAKVEPGVAIRSFRGRFTGGFFGSTGSREQQVGHAAFSHGSHQPEAHKQGFFSEDLVNSGPAAAEEAAEQKLRAAQAQEAELMAAEYEVVEAIDDARDETERAELLDELESLDGELAAVVEVEEDAADAVAAAEAAKAAVGAGGSAKPAADDEVAAEAGA
jgi:hypothetical protein